MTTEIKLKYLAEKWNEIQESAIVGTKYGQSIMSQIRALPEYKDDNINFTKLMALHGHKQSQEYVNGIKDD